jgi:hypothetical protein
MGENVFISIIIAKFIQKKFGCNFNLAQIHPLSLLLIPSTSSNAPVDVLSRFILLPPNNLSHSFTLLCFLLTFRPKLTQPPGLMAQPRN